MIDSEYALDGRVAVVTGGSGALGEAIARGLARAGAAVCILARRRERVEETVERLRAGGADALGVPADVLSRSDLDRALAAVQRRWGRVDILVNAAGGNTAGALLADGATLADLPEPTLREVIDLNLLGTWLPIQTFGAAMAGAQPPAGAIVNISSIAARRALTRVGPYGAAKAAVESLTRWLAVDGGFSAYSGV